MDVINIVYSSLSLGGLGLIFGIGLGYASKKFSVEEDARVPEVRAVLPGANCGACGFPGCDACASAIVSGDASIDACTVGGIKVAVQVGKILGISVDKQEKEKKTAFVKCCGNSTNRKARPEFTGIANCSEALAMQADGVESMDCIYGCLGLGSCTKACKFGAISIIDGVAEVDEEKCTGCGVCIKACPKVIIELVPISRKVRTACSSYDKAKTVREICSTGCIGCTLCVKACQYGAIIFENNLAKVDYEKCVQCMACVSKCPSKAIREQVKGTPIQ